MIPAALRSFILTMLLDPTGEPSQIWMPRIDIAEENGPKVMAALLLADPAGEFAAANKALTRE